MERVGSKSGTGTGVRGERGGVARSWDSAVAGTTEREKDQKLEASAVSSEKCLSQETGEPLGPVSHRERL